jgi:hypothetical protein
MKKPIKIVLLAILILFILFVDLVAYEIYKEVTFYNRAEDLGFSTPLGSKAFNLKIEDCSPSYGGLYSSEKWEIRGIENDKCILIYNVADLSNVSNAGEIFYVPTMTCELPKEIYSNPEEMDAKELINKGYCVILKEDLVS